MGSGQCGRALTSIPTRRSIPCRVAWPSCRAPNRVRLSRRCLRGVSAGRVYSTLRYDKQSERGTALHEPCAGLLGLSRRHTKSVRTPSGSGRRTPCVVRPERGRNASRPVGALDCIRQRLLDALSPLEHARRARHWHRDQSGATLACDLRSPHDLANRSHLNPKNR